MKETSDAVAEIAGKGMKQALTRAEQKAVCASALAQREIMAGFSAIRRRVNRIKKKFPDAAEELDALLNDLRPVR